MIGRGVICMGDRGGEQTPERNIGCMEGGHGVKVEGIVNFGPNMERFLLTLGSRIWYVVGVYVPPHDAPSFCCIEQALAVSLKVMNVILLIYINVRLKEPWYDREDELAMALAGIELKDVTAHFTPRQRY